jgi:hypothetical protein
MVLAFGLLVLGFLLCFPSVSLTDELFLAPDRVAHKPKKKRVV